MKSLKCLYCKRLLEGYTEKQMNHMLAQHLLVCKDKPIETTQKKKKEKKDDE